MAKIISLTLIIALFLIIQTVKGRESSPAECQIYNERHRTYIYAEYKLFGLGSTREILPYRSFKDDLYDLIGKEIKVEYSDKDPSGIWIFEPVYDHKNTFYLRNKKYNNDYLTGSRNYQEKVGFRENWYTWASNKHPVNDEFYMWRFNRTGDTGRYYIWNVKLGSPLYTRKFPVRKVDPLVISLKDGSMDGSDMFEWILKCSDGLLPEFSD